MEITTEQKNTLFIAGGAAAGVLQAKMLMMVADGTVQDWMSNLKQITDAIPDSMSGFKKPSALLGIIGGAAGLILSLTVMKDSQYSSVMASYGGSSLLMGVLSGLNMITQPATATCATSCTSTKGTCVTSLFAAPKCTCPTGTTWDTDKTGCITNKVS